jgi:hypothetical protein
MKNIKRNFLLPHCFQLIGWGLFVFGFIGFFGGLYLFNTLKLIPQSYSKYLTLLEYIIFYSSALFVGFSREKIEDELTMVTRFNSLAITAYTTFIVFVMFQLVLVVNQPFNLINWASHRPLYYFILTFINPITIFMLYILIFRVSLFRFRKSVKDEE